MSRINENELAKQIAGCEGRKVQVNIAQIKEVLRVGLAQLALEDDRDVLALVHRHFTRPRSTKVRRKSKRKGSTEPINDPGWGGE